MCQVKCVYADFSFTLGLSICLMSYAGQMRAAILADKAVLQEESDVSILISAFEQEIQTLAKLSGIRELNCFDTRYEVASN